MALTTPSWPGAERFARNLAGSSPRIDAPGDPRAAVDLTRRIALDRLSVGRQHVLSQDQTRTDAASGDAAAVVRAPAAASVVTLQSTIGNRAVARAIQASRLGAAGTVTAPRRVLARVGGLRRTRDVSEFANDALAFWNDKANKDKPLEGYATHLMTKVNRMLADLSYPASKYVIDKAGSVSGSFSRVTWTITINPDKFSNRQDVTKVGDLTADEAAEIADTIYHESRHCEQYFQIARVQAGRMKTGTKDPAAKIAKDMSIPNDIAKAAVRYPLTAERGGAETITETEDWESITVGRHGEYKANINEWGNEADKLDDEVEAVKAYDVDSVKATVEASLSGWKKNKDRMKFLKSHLATTKKIKRQSEVDRRVVTYLTDIKAKFDTLDAAATAALKNWKKVDSATRLQRLQGLQASAKALRRALYAAYEGHIHEEDAWATGRAVGKQFRDEELAERHAREKAEKEAREKAEKEAADKQKAAEAQTTASPAPVTGETTAPVTPQPVTDVPVVDTTAELVEST